jgi:hypothetical protein
MQQVISQGLEVCFRKLFGFFNVTLHQIGLFRPDNGFLLSF